MSCCRGSEVGDNSDKSKIRRCTDVFALSIFITFLFLFIVIASFAFVFGKPSRIFHGYDSFGNVCGMKNDKIGSLELSGLDMGSKTFVFYLDMSNISKSLKICVSTCPNRTLVSMGDLLKFYNETGSSLCRYDFDYSKAIGENDLFSSSLGPCPVFPVYDSKVVLQRCVPRPITDVTRNILSHVIGVANDWDTIEQVLGDVYSAAEILGITIILVFGIAGLTSVLIYNCAAAASWFLLIATAIISWGLTIVLWLSYASVKWQLDEEPVQFLLLRSIHNEHALLILSILATILTLALSVVLLVLRKQISFVSHLFKETNRCIQNTGSCLTLLPVMTFLILILFYVLWVFVALCLATANFPHVVKMRPYADLQVDSTMPRTHFANQEESSTVSSSLEPLDFSVDEVKEHESFTLVKYAEGTWVKYLWWAHIIALFWIPQFILDCQHLIISGTIALWYFESKADSREQSMKSNSGNFCFKSVKNMVFYHLGSVALGSFLILLFKIPRLILTFWQHILKRNNESEVTKVCVKCCTCCFYCMECFIKFMNHNAYAVIAMQGHGFCTSARIAFTSISSNALKFAVLNSVGDFILFLGKVFVTVLTTLVFLLYFRTHGDVHFYVIPVILSGIFAYFVADSFMSLFESAVDTLFLCLCEDSRLNGESEQWKSMKLVQVSAQASGVELAPINS